MQDNDADDMTTPLENDDMLAAIQAERDQREQSITLFAQDVATFYNTLRARGVMPKHLSELTNHYLCHLCGGCGEEED